MSGDNYVDPGLNFKFTLSFFPADLQMITVPEEVGLQASLDGTNAPCYN